MTKFLLLAIICVPFVLSVFVGNFESFSIAGSIDGWLGFLGGYSGGLMAFLSAYWIFTHEQKQKNKTWIYLQSEHTTPTLITETNSSLVFECNQSDSSFDVENRMFTNKGVYPVAVITFKNVSANFAKNVSLAISGRTLRKLYPSIHHEGRDQMIRHNFVGDLPINASFSFYLHIDPELHSKNNTVDFVLTSQNLQNETSKQKVTLLVNRESGAWDFVNRT